MFHFFCFYFLEIPRKDKSQQMIEPAWRRRVASRGSSAFAMADAGLLAHECSQRVIVLRGRVEAGMKDHRHTAEKRMSRSERRRLSFGDRKALWGRCGGKKAHSGIVTLPPYSWFYLHLMNVPQKEAFSCSAFPLRRWSCDRWGGLWSSYHWIQRLIFKRTFFEKCVWLNLNSIHFQAERLN